MTSSHHGGLPIDDLLSRLLDARLDDNERDQLLDLLQRDPRVRELYHAHIALHAMLHWIDSEPSGHEVKEPPLIIATLSDASPPSRKPILGFLGSAMHGTASHVFEGWPLAYLLATVIVVTGLMLGGLIPVPPLPQVARESSFPSEVCRNGDARRVGRVTGMFDCRWAPGTPVARDGDDVRLGRPFNLEGGLLEISYETGATIVLEGPAEYTVASARSGVLSSGRLTGKMTTEHSRGFAVRTPTANVVDLGTEFGVEVDVDGSTRSHVFVGVVRVELLRDDKPMQGQTVDLHANESVVVGKRPDSDERVLVVQSIAVKPERFVRSDQLAEAVSRRKLEAFHRWQQRADTLRRDPALVVFYDFQQHADSPNVLHAEANGAASSLDGVIQGATWSSGRMPGKQSLRFDGVASHVKVDLPREMPQMTLAAWLTVEFVNDNGPSCGLLMSDGWDSREKCHWQIVRPGEVHLGSGGEGLRTSTVLPWQDWSRNRWRHVAVVCDPPRREIVCYLDGVRVGVSEISGDFSATFGRAQIGGWQSVDGKEERGLRGRMDELMILGRTMTDEEIRELHSIGNP